MARACAIALLLSGCGSDPEQPGEPVQAAAGLRLEARSGTSLTGTVGTRIDSVPVVLLTTRDGAPAPGREVRFAVSGGGSTGVTSQRTDAAGIASPGIWTLGTVARPETLTASSPGAVDVVFTAAVRPGRPAAIAITAGNNQSASAGEPLPASLQVKLTDRYGNPVPEEPVTYAVIAGSGSIAANSTRTDAFGIASSGAWTLGDAGAQLVRTSAAGKDTVFEAFACGDTCRGRDLLFTKAGALYSRINGRETLLFARPRSDTYGAAWSPDGQRIASWVYDWDADDVFLYVMDADGSHASLLAPGFSKPSWSPDGRHLVAWGPSGVYALSAEPDGTLPALLRDRGIDPAWSPDGTKIAFVDAGSGSSLTLMNPDGSAVTTLVPGSANVSIGDPTWSPDGGRLAFMNCDRLTGCSVLVVGADGTGLMQLAAGGGPAWSPDGSRIAFRSGEDVVWAPINGSLSQPLMLVEGATSAAWRP